MDMDSDGFGLVPESLREMLEQALRESGITDDYMTTIVDNPSTCPFGENGDSQDVFWTTFSNVLRIMFLGGTFRTGLKVAASTVAVSDMNDFLENGPLTKQAWESYVHVHMHVTDALFERVARDAIEPWVASLHALGLYRPTGNDVDFACVLAAEAAKAEQEAKEEEPPSEG